MKPNPKIMKRWSKALRSGNYQQGFGRLRRKVAPGQFEYCCLGVLCEIYLEDHPEVEWDNTDGFGEKHKEFHLPVRVAIWAGLEDRPIVKIDDKNSRSFIELNDSGRSFSEIADLLS